METIASKDELKSRWQKCQLNLTKYCPDADGLMVFSRLNIFYLTGTFVNGILWLPREGEPVLLCRKGIDRILLESEFSNVHEFKSYKDIKDLFKHLRYDLPNNVAAEMNGLSWGLSQSLTKHLPSVNFSAGDLILASTRSVKSPFELAILRKAGEAHGKCLSQLLPKYLNEGISEAKAAEKCLNLFFENGHHGILRMEKFGEEIFFGHSSIGDSANYPSVFNGPVGLKGFHPGATFMGSREVHWQKGLALTIDNGFCYAGYQTDKTQVYWLGGRNSIPQIVKDGHKFCVEIQDFIADKMVPGAIPAEIYQESMNLVNNSLFKEGFMGLGNNKVNFIAHGIGLAIDEYPVIANGFTEPLEEGMVLAVEPKLGIKGVGMVGPENTFEVTPSGGKSITGNNFEIICID
ncbi:MAG: M24 family metallopeptidase [Desulfotalea sp.]